MITGLIVSALLALIDGLVSFMPSVSLPALVDLVFFKYVLVLNTVFPLVALFTAIVLGFGVELALRLWDLIVWVYHQFWGSS